MTQGHPTDEDSAPNPLLLAPRYICTRNLYLYARRAFSIFDLFYLGVNLASHIDDQRLKFAEVLAESGEKEHGEALERVKQNKELIFDRLKGYSELQSENMVIRLVDNFLYYISNIMQDVLRKNPEMLSSNVMVRIDEIVKFSRMKDLISYLVDRKLNELSYGGLREIEKFLMSRTGIQLSKQKREKATLIHAIEMRNIYTHNRGIVNEVFVQRLSGIETVIPFKKGKRLHADYDNIVLLANTMTRVCARIDGSASKKYRIGTKKFINWAKAYNIDKYRLNPGFKAEYMGDF
jgi:hypothetical protein